MIKTCLGCGVKLQSTDEKKIGYIPLEVLNKGYCKRCYKLTHYNDFKNAYQKVDPNDILKKLDNKKGFCFFLLDLVNLNREAFNYYHQIKMPKILIINKADIIPQNILYEKIKIWLQNNFQIKEDILFVSTKKNIGITKIQNLIEDINEPIYFLGMTNVGKSSLLNKLFELEKPLTTSMLPNTTLDFIKVKTKKVVYDTVGFPYIREISSDYLKKMMINEEIHPKNMPIKKEANLLIEDIVRIKIDIDNSITCFFSKNLKISKIYDNNKLYLDEKPLIIKVPAYSNVFIKGLGFGYIKNACTLTVYHLDENLIEVLPSFWGKGFENE